MTRLENNCPHSWILLFDFRPFRRLPDSWPKFVQLLSPFHCQLDANAHIKGRTKGCAQNPPCSIFVRFLSRYHLKFALFRDSPFHGPNSARALRKLGIGVRQLHLLHNGPLFAIFAGYIRGRFLTGSHTSRLAKVTCSTFVLTRSDYKLISRLIRLIRRESY